MNKRKLLTMVLALVLIGAVGIGATLAYFTDKEEATNIVTMGHVDIELTEDAWTHGEEGITGVMPGQVIAKDPTITVAQGSLDAYVRVKLTVTGFEGMEDADAYKKDILDSLVLNDGWSKKADGYYYYSEKLTAGASTTAVFDNVVIPYDWTNAVADAKFNIEVVAEAIQADNLEDGFVTEDGWNITAEEILAYGEE